MFEVFVPPETQEIKPHPYGVEFGSFLQMLKGTEETQLSGFLNQSFCRVPPAAVKEVAKAASTKSEGTVSTLLSKPMRSGYPRGKRRP